MLKKYLNTFFFILSSVISLIAQESKSDYFNYYLNVYKAEEKICKNEFDSALSFYSKSFEKYHKVFFYDMYNAAICAEKSGSYHDLDSILKLLCSYGYDVDFINNNSFTKLDSLNKNQFRSICSKLNSTFFNNIDAGLEKECSVRVENEQLTNIKRMNDGTVESLKKLNTVIYENIEWLISIIDSCGYPDRKLIGNSYEPNYSVVGIMLIHYFQQKIKKYEPVLRDSLLRNIYFKYEEDSIINRYDSIPVLKIISHEVAKGNMNLGEYVKYHNSARTLNEGKNFYKLFYKSDTYPPIFGNDRDSVLIEASLELEKLISIYSKKTGQSDFQLGKSLFRLSTNEDYKWLFKSKFENK
ncbi:MAG: hypothetical protein ACQESQ_08775 [Bacteroidota bacterium]